LTAVNRGVQWVRSSMKRPKTKISGGKGGGETRREVPTNLVTYVAGKEKKRGGTGLHLRNKQSRQRWGQVSRRKGEAHLKASGGGSHDDEKAQPCKSARVGSQNDQSGTRVSSKESWRNHRKCEVEKTRGERWGRGQTALRQC